jgi:hypothetical protein
MKRIAWLLPLLGAACAAPAVRTARLDPVDPLPYAFDVRVDAADAYVVTRVPVAADQEPPDEAALEGVRRLVAPGSWSRGALFVDGREIVIRHAPAVADRAKDALAAIDGSRDKHATVVVHLVRTAAAHLSDLRNLRPSDAGPLVGTFDRRRLQEVVSSWEEAEALTTPRLTVRHGQPADIVVSNQFAYIRGYEPMGPVWDPVVGIVNDGIRLGVTAAPNGTRKGETAIALDVDLSSLLEGPRDVLTVLFENRRVEIPGVASTRATVRFALSRDHAFLVVVRNPDARDRAHPLVAIVIEVDEGE